MELIDKGILALLGFALITVGIVIGVIMAPNNEGPAVRREAVLKGYAEYSHTETGSPQWQWKTK